jgi:hypothetical protein
LGQFFSIFFDPSIGAAFFHYFYGFPEILLGSWALSLSLEEVSIDGIIPDQLPYDSINRWRSPSQYV